MNMSLNTEKSLIIVPLREIETGVDYVIECHPVNLLNTVINTMRYKKEFVVLREKMVLTHGERLVLEHEDLLQRIRDKIDELFVRHVVGLGYIQMTPQRYRHDQLKRLLKLEEPTWIPLLGPRHCAGCGTVIAGGKKALRVRAKEKNAVCCGYNCYGLMLAAGTTEQDHGS